MLLDPYSNDVLDDYNVQVPDEVASVVEDIRRYNPDLRVRFLNPNHPSTLTDAPYALYEVCKDGVERHCFDIWQLDRRVLEKVIAHDARRTDVLGNLDKHNAAIRKAEETKILEVKEQSKDLTVRILRSPKSSYSFKQEVEGQKRLVTIHDTKPPDIKELD